MLSCSKVTNIIQSIFFNVPVHKDIFFVMGVSIRSFFLLVISTKLLLEIGFYLLAKKNSKCIDYVDLKR